MKDIKGFCKLIGINIPDYDNFDYYINQLSKLDKWKNIYNLIEIYEQDELKFGDLFSIRINKSNEIINFLKSSRSYNNMIDDNLLPNGLIQKKVNYTSEKKYLSIDIKKANWTCIKKYDPDFINELGETYEDFLNKFDVPNIFHESKQLRQYIFGNLNPKRQGKVQRSMIQSIIDSLNYLNLNIEGINNDEVIYSFKSYDEILDIINIDDNIFNYTIYTIDKIEDFFIRTYYSINGEKLHKNLFGCNGNMFFVNLKKYITNESIDIRDLIFRVDGNLAIWKIDGLKISL